MSSDGKPVIIRSSGELGVGAAFDLHVALDRERDQKLREAAERVDKDIEERMARVRDRVPPPLRRMFDAMREQYEEQKALEADSPKCEGCGIPLFEADDYRIDEDGIALCAPCGRDRDAAEEAAVGAGNPDDELEARREPYGDD